MSTSRYLPAFALVTLPLVWGYTWVAVKVGLGYSSPFVFAAIRTFPGGILLLALVAATGRSLRPKPLGLTVLLGILQTGGFIGLTTGALVSGGAGRTAILGNTWQFWILLMAWPILGERLRGTQWLSVLLALGGLVMIIAPWKLHGVTSSLLGLGGSVSWAASAIVAKVLHRGHKVDLLALNAWQTMFGSILLVILALSLERNAPHWTQGFILSLAYSLVVATGVASLLWLFVLRRMPATIAGLGTMATPVVGLLLSWAQLGEQPTALEGVGMVVILMGMAILFARGVTGVSPAPRGHTPADASRDAPHEAHREAPGEGPHEGAAEALGVTSVGQSP